MYSIAILGGSFDPIHNGHLQTSLCIQREFNFDSYRFLPCKQSVTKPPTLANTSQRIEMIKLAIKDYTDFSIDLREINRNTPSYMVDTLANLRTENKNASLTLILGYDAFLSLPKWHQWEKIIKLANLLVINRDEFGKEPEPEEIKILAKNHESKDKAALLNHVSEVIYMFNAGKYTISSTEIRTNALKLNNIKDKLPDAVYHYIKKEGLYQ